MPDPIRPTNIRRAKFAGHAAAERAARGPGITQALLVIGLLVAGWWIWRLSADHARLQGRVEELEHALGTATHATDANFRAIEKAADDDAYRRRNAAQYIEYLHERGRR